jgi:hypothetical protein
MSSFIHRIVADVTLTTFRKHCSTRFSMVVRTAMTTRLFAFVSSVGSRSKEEKPLFRSERRDYEEVLFSKPL